MACSGLVVVLLCMFSLVQLDNTTKYYRKSERFVLNNKRSGIIEPCEQHTLKECQGTDCSNGETLPDGWYEVIFDPMISGGFCKLYRVF